MANLRLSAFQDGELPGALAAEMARHLQDCPTCRAELAALKELSGRLGRLSPVVAGADFSLDIMSGLRARPERKFGLLQAAAYALALAMIFIGGFLLEISSLDAPEPVAPPDTSFSAVLAESRDLGLQSVQEGTLALFNGETRDQE